MNFSKKYIDSILIDTIMCKRHVNQLLNNREISQAMSVLENIMLLSLDFEYNFGNLELFLIMRVGHFISIQKKTMLKNICFALLTSLKRLEIL